MNTLICLNHVWMPTDGGYECADCPETTGTCHTCQGPLPDANLICPRCLTHARRTLADITEAATTPYTYPHLGIRAIRYDTDRRPTTGETSHAGSTPRHDPGLDELGHAGSITGVDLLAILRDPPNVLEPLLDWADSWATTRGEDAHGTNAIAYLDSRLLWAANNPGVADWGQFLEEARTIRARLRRLVGLAPTHHPRPCVHCGGSIIQQQSDDGLEDLLRCTGCGMTWDDREHLARLERHTIQMAPYVRPDTLVTVEAARAALPQVRRGTINVALHRDRKLPAEQRRIPERGTNARGETLYRLGDLAEVISAARAGTLSA